MENENENENEIENDIENTVKEAENPRTIFDKICGIRVSEKRTELAAPLGEVSNGEYKVRLPGAEWISWSIML